MEPAHTIGLELGERTLPVQVQRVRTARSSHTGQRLTELQGVATTTDPTVHQWLSLALQELGEKTVETVEPWNEGLRRWNVSWNSYAESGGEHSYTLILRQAEELSLESLVVGDVELHPYAYREAVSGAELTIWAKCVGSKTEVLRLRALLKARSSFPVIRHGISEEPRPMRFGVAEWSEHEGRIKFRVIFVDRDADPGEHPELVRIEEENTRAAAGYYMNFVDELAELLERRGILPAEEIEAAREAARSRRRTRQEFWQVSDVDLL